MPDTEPTSYDRMLLIAYSVRPGSEAKGYEQWLRDVDNPFFNAAPGFAHYTNWKVVGGTNHFAPHVYFDFVGMQGSDAFDAVWNGSEVNEFRREWRRLWGVDTLDERTQIQTSLCVRSLPASGRLGRHIALAPGNHSGTVWGSWETSRLLRGANYNFGAFSVRSGDSLDSVASTSSPVDLLAECIAAPGQARA